MKILFGTALGFAPEAFGGVQSSTDHLVRVCRDKGHDAMVFAGLYGSGLFGLRARVKLKLSRRSFVTDRHLGYPVLRSWFPEETISQIAEHVRPDVAVIESQKTVPIGRQLSALGIPTVVYLRNVEFGDHGGDLTELAGAKYIANSKFTARAHKERFGIESVVIPPTIESSRYETETTKEFVTFINPQARKGYDLALKIARTCPEIPFRFVEGWILVGDELSAVQQDLSSLKNVTFSRRTSDMKTVYGRSKILLAPSQWEEAWGRVASEAHCSGIPVIGSDRGGLPEAIGPGGIVMPNGSSVSDWADTLREIWFDDARYAELSSAALTYSRRSEVSLDHQFDTLEATLKAAIAQG